jgi:hypothetical protein
VVAIVQVDSRYDIGATGHFDPVADNWAYPRWSTPFGHLTRPFGSVCRTTSVGDSTGSRIAASRKTNAQDRR